MSLAVHGTEFSRQEVRVGRQVRTERRIGQRAAGDVLGWKGGQVESGRRCATMVAIRSGASSSVGGAPIQ